MLMCATGKALEIEPGDTTPNVYAKNPDGSEHQKFYPLKIISPMMPDKEFCFIGKFVEKDMKGDPQVFFTILEDGTACMKAIDSYLLNAKNKQNTIDMCWSSAYREIEAKEFEMKRPEQKKESNEGKDDATLGDLVGMMGGLMAAFAPPEQRAEIGKQMSEIQKMGETVGALFQGFGEECEELINPGYTWVKMESDELPEYALPAGKDQSDTFNVWVGKAEENGEVRVGKVHNKNRYFASEGKHESRVTSQPFYVLCVDPGAESEWVECKNGIIPKNAVIGDKSAEKGSLYVGRGYINRNITFINALTPGFIFTDQEPFVLNALWGGGDVHSLDDFEILVVKKKEAQGNQIKDVKSKGKEEKIIEIHPSQQEEEEKTENTVYFYLEKQAPTEARPGRPGRPGLYLTNPENTNKLVLAEQDFSPSQTWYWSNNMLMCATGKVLDIDGNFKPGDDAPVLVWEPHGGENQQFYPLKIESPMMPEKEFCLIGRLVEKDQKPSNSERVFFNIKEDGTACLNTVDSYLLEAKNKQNTLDMCWNFVYRQVPAEEGGTDDNKREATLGDLLGVMGGLMAAFAPPEQGAEIQKQVSEMGKQLNMINIKIEPKPRSITERRWAKAEGYFVNETDFFGTDRHEYLLITYQDGAWQAMKIVGDRNVPRGKVSFRTKKVDMKANITELIDAEVQIRSDIEDEEGFSWEPTGSLKYDETSDKWSIQFREETHSFERCHKMEALQAAGKPDWN